MNFKISDLIDMFRQCQWFDWICNKLWKYEQTNIVKCEGVLQYVYRYRNCYRVNYLSRIIECVLFYTLKQLRKFMN